MTLYAQTASSLGRILLCANGAYLNGLYFAGQKDCPPLAGLPVLSPRSGDPTAGMMDGVPLKGLRVRQRQATADLFHADELAFGAPGKPKAGAAPQLGPLSLMQENTPDPTRRVFELAHRELAEYFDGRRQQFTVPLELQGTPFQKKVWEALLGIPYGRTVSYGDVAASAGLGGGHGRPVGTAVGRNPITIMVPCHRVLSSNHRLNGYTGGLDRKFALLQLEGLLVG